VKWQIGVGIANLWFILTACYKSRKIELLRDCRRTPGETKWNNHTYREPRHL